VDDQDLQFEESLWNSGAHFTENVQDAIQFISTKLTNMSGGFDIAEDYLGAINHCTKWQSQYDWTSEIKFMILLTDAPAHGLVDNSFMNMNVLDHYPDRHPKGLNGEHVMGDLIKSDISLFLCSFNPIAIQKTEKELSKLFLDHPHNKEHREITVIPMVPHDMKNESHENKGTIVLTRNANTPSTLGMVQARHIIFVLDESGSMNHSWLGVVATYNKYIKCRRQKQCDFDQVSVIQFGNSARVTVRMQTLSQAPVTLDYEGGGTQFAPTAEATKLLVQKTPESYLPIVVFMSDGQSSDAAAAAKIFHTINRQISHREDADLELYVIAFGGVDSAQLSRIAGASRRGKFIQVQIQLNYRIFLLTLLAVMR